MGSTYTLRLSRELLDKLHYVASYDGRSANMEIVQLIKEHVAEFEAKHGKIND
ncbi:MAG: Arc family DNA-binding protein [Christensenella sp.]|uniref:Arc family DNA-binding protein n=1 Tax=Christensenella sp. TaxID=1935934 RepID=UPI002B213DB9|nr:Arc family DNA-binding protein [Christensenella sp.]MEA5003499.1 Arc family DNA-binding protein [Christensenella sp.]